MTQARPVDVSAVAPAAQAERGNGPVAGYAATQSVTATKTDTPILETPQSISVVTKDQVEAQGAKTVSEAMHYTPGITTNLFGINGLFDTIIVRGFEAPLFLDGLRLPKDSATTFANARIVPYGLERIEVLRGPSGGLYGQTPPGGLVNMISKLPSGIAQNEVQFQTGSFNRAEGSLDTTGPLDPNGQWLYRVVGLARNADTQIDYQQDNQYYLAPSLTFRPTTDTSFTALATIQQYSGRGYQQYVPATGTALPDPFGRIPYSRYLGEPNQDYFRLNQKSVGYLFEHRFNEIFQFRSNLRYTEIDVQLLALRDEGMLPDLRTVPRSELFVAGKTQGLAVDNQLQADFSTGPLIHKVLTGIDYYRTQSDSGFKFAPGTNIDAFAPVYGAPQVPLASMFDVLQATGDLRQTGVYVQDQIKLDRWLLSLTGRYDAADETTFDKLAFTTDQQQDHAATYRAGLGYRFDEGVVPYILRSTSFEPTAGVDVSSNPFRPTTGTSNEIGVKYQPNGMKALFTAAVFDTTQQNVLTPDLTNPLFSIQTGEVRVKGFEFEARASLTDRLDIVGGYSRLDPRITRDNSGNIGNYMPNFALETASLWAKYTMRDGAFAGWGFGGGVRYAGKSYADAANSFAISPYLLFDASLSYDFSYFRPDLRGLKLQINATNLTDHYYQVNCFGLNYCALGQARTILLTLKYQWPAAPDKPYRTSELFTK